MALNKLMLLLLITGSISTTSAKMRYQIGAIFHKDNHEAEVSFRNAVSRENMYSKNFELTPIIKHVERDDSFQAQRIACELISDRVVAIFGPSSPQTTKIVGSICNEFGIPHILANWLPEDEVDTSDNHRYTRNFFPDNNFYAKALAQIVTDYKWNGFTLIYETNDSLERLVEVLQLHDRKDSPVKIRQLPPDTDDFMNLLKEIKASMEKRILIDCSPENVMTLLKQAVVVGLVAEYQSYIITSLDSHSLDFPQLKFIEANTTTIRIMDPGSIEVRVGASDVDYNEAGSIKTETALFHDAVQVFSAAFNELSWTQIHPPSFDCASYVKSKRTDDKSENDDSGKWKHGRQILQKMDQRNEGGMTGRILFDDDGKRKDFHMEILELKEGRFEKVAILDPKISRLNITRSADAADTNIMESKTLNVGAVISAPYLMRKENPESDQDEDMYEGYSMDLMNMISRNYSFKYKFVIEKSQGQFDKTTKKSSGLIKLLLDGKADMAICDFTITYERRQVVDFTLPFMSLGISILFAAPKKEKPTTFSFMLPLSRDVWLYTATAYLCVSLLLFFLAMIAVDDWQSPTGGAGPVSQKESSPNSGSSDNSGIQLLETIWNMHSSIWLVAGSIMQQGCDILPRAISTRLAASLWWFFALIVISSYTANLAAFLTTTRMEDTIKNVEDLAKQTEIKYGTVGGGSTMAFFKNSNHSTYQRMWAAMESASPSAFAKDNDEGISRVLKGNQRFAFLMESTSIEYNVAKNDKLIQVGGLLDSKGYGIALPSNSRYRKLLNQAILKLQENGELGQLKEKWWKKSEEKEEEEDESALQWESIAGCFYVLLGGIAIATLLAIFEFIWNVHSISVESKVHWWEICKDEMRFAIDLRKTTKPVRKNPSTPGSISSVSSKSTDTGHRSRSGYQIGLERINNELI